MLERAAGHGIQLACNALRLEMLPEVLPLAQKKGFGVIARVPLYYGILAGKFTPHTTFPTEDHRSHTLPPETMRELVPRAERLKKYAEAQGLSFTPWSLRFAFSHPSISTAIVGARDAKQADENFGASGAPLLQAQVEAVYKLWREDAYLRELRTGL